MVFKLLITTAAIFVVFTAAQYPSWDDGELVDDELPEQQCNETVCHIPCEGAGPPAFCPLNVPDCASGCACYLDCSTNTLTCFMTKYCTKIRRFLTKRRHARAVSQDVDLSLSSVAQTPPASTVDQVNIQRAEQNLTTSTDAHGIIGQGKQDSSASTATQNNSGGDKQAFLTSSSTRGRVERDLASSTVTQAVSQSTGKNTASTVVQSTGGRVERELTQSTVVAPSQETSSIEYATFRAQSDAITLAQPINIDYKRLEKEAEKAAELKVKKAAEKNAEKKVAAKAKMANAGAGVVADVAAGCVVIFACIYRCLGSLFPGNP